MINAGQGGEADDNMIKEVVNKRAVVEVGEKCRDAEVGDLARIGAKGKSSLLNNKWLHATHGLIEPDYTTVNVGPNPVIP